MPPFADYGSRQIALYYRFVDPHFRDKSLTLQYIDAPLDDWTWASRQWTPDPADGRPVYVFRRDHLKPLSDLGFTIEERTFTTLGPCGRAHPSTVFFRAVSAR
ncbi:MAG: hypothetical protein JWM74_324 [Myxococcaceae bacterium]|nr:hypothetical protein [Myxococcaceae bacterium]